MRDLSRVDCTAHHSDYMPIQYTIVITCSILITCTPYRLQTQYRLHTCRLYWTILIAYTVLFAYTILITYTVLIAQTTIYFLHFSINFGGKHSEEFQTSTGLGVQFQKASFPIQVALARLLIFFFSLLFLVCSQWLCQDDVET